MELRVLPLLALSALLGGAIRIAIKEIRFMDILMGEATVIIPINCLGCAILGIVKYQDIQLSHLPSEDLRRIILSAVGIGLCGSLTSFSTVLWEEVALVSSSVEQKSGMWACLLEVAIHSLIAVATAITSFTFTFNLSRDIQQTMNKRASRKEHSRDDESEVKEPSYSEDYEVTSEEPTLQSYQPSRPRSEVSEPPAPSIKSSMGSTSLEVLDEAKHYIHYSLVLRWTFAVLTLIGFLIFLGLHMAFKDTTNWFYLAIAICPVGAVLRYFLSSLNFTRGLHKEKRIFPVGTLIANVWAVVMVVVFKELAEKEVITDNLALVVCDGFCGSLSTMSTFAFELFSGNGLESLGYYTLSEGACIGTGLILIAVLKSVHS